MKLLPRHTLPVVLALALAGCSWFGGSKTDNYKSASQARAAQPLEVPPELSAPTADDRYSIPDPHSQTSYSEYSRETRSQAAEAPAGPAVLPPVKQAHVERDGNQRWLVVDGEPAKVWPQIRQFWIDNGFTLVREDPELGIMETDWHDDTTKIPQDWVRRTVGRWISGLYSTPRREKFRIRLERGVKPGTTEVYLSSRAVEEIFTNVDQSATAWQPLPPDANLEAEMLTAMMMKLGGEETKVAAAAPTTEVAAGHPAPAVAPVAETQPSGAVLENAGAGPLVVNDGFDRAWRRVGLALDRVGFTVEDRDRSKGLFYVRYIDPEAEAAAEKKKGIIDDIAFWRSKPKGPKPQYRIVVSDAGTNTSHVQVQDSKGTTEESPTGKKILALLYEQLK
ncbi:MAG TPA: outer membrane protein assembly factor BamC [Usitatibacter sp.]|nr:outer membrane protein assembly factor BamC [Usitatibacter sp.]